MKLTSLVSIFSSKARLDHPNPKKRLEALSSLSDKDQSEFLRVLSEDSDLEVRKAALARIDDDTKLADFVDDDGLGTAIAARLVPHMEPESELLQNGHLLKAYVSSLSTVDGLVAVMRNSTITRQVVELILQKDDEDLKSQIVASLSSQEELVAFEDATKRTDRQLNRQIRDRLNEFKSLKHDVDAKLSYLEELRGAATALNVSERNYDSLRDAHERRWASAIAEIEDLNQRLVAFGEAAIDVESEKANFPDRQQADETARSETPDFARILAVFEDSNKDLPAIEKAESDWLDGLKRERPPAELSDRFDKDIQTARSTIFRGEEADRLESWLLHLTRAFEFTDPQKREEWNNLKNVKRHATRRIQEAEEFERELSHVSIDPSVAESWTAKLAAVKKECADVFQRCQDLEQESEVELEKHLGRLEELTSAGSLSKAIPIERETRNLIQRFQGNRAEAYKNKLAPFSAQIVEYLRWRSFAVMPKRVELCTAIEEAAKTPLEPRQQLALVKSLRQQWNELGPVANAEEAKLQEQYNEHAVEAYKVCEQWFKEMDTLKKDNIQQREVVCNDLEHYIDENDWETPHWKNVSRTLRVAKESYHGLTPVDRAAGRKLDKRFRALTSKIQKRINTQYKENTKAKQELIVEAKAVFEDNELDSKALLERIKELQATWKTIGPASKKEQSLWEEFRGVCDLAYDAVNRARTERRDSIDSNINAANDLVEDLTAFVDKTDGSDRKAIHDALASCRDQLQDLFLPKRVRQDLDRKLNDIRKQVKETAAKAKEQSKNSRLVEILELEAQLAECELKDEPIPEEWFDTAGSDSVLFETRTAETSDDDLRDLVLRAEMVAKIGSSSEDDEQRRLQLRVEYLKDNIGRGKEASEDTAEVLIKQWVGKAHGEQELRNRFRSAIDAILNAA